MLCPGGCGHYLDEAHDDDNDRGYEVREELCHACAAREEWQRDHEGKDRPEPGTLTYVVKLPRARPAGRLGKIRTAVRASDQLPRRPR